jgi:phosphatidylcholine synthase
MAAAAPQTTPVRATLLAWGVHALTASGAVIGAVALLAIAAGDLAQAAVLMLVALVIDSVDGTLARAARVHDVLPSFDGRRLDDMVDYLNYVIVPAVFMVWSGGVLSWHWAAFPILASAYGFSQDDAKTDDDFFLGFPSYWNVIAIYLWLFGTPAVAGTALVTVFAALVFVPFKYLYPSKMPVFRKATAAAALLWVLSLGACVLAPEHVRQVRLLELSLLFPLYYFAMSLHLGGLHRPGR